MAAQPDYLDFSIPVPHPTLELALTAPRESDGESRLVQLNHPAIYMNLEGPPFPYTEKDWTDWYTLAARAFEQSFAELQVIRKQQHTQQASQHWSERTWLGKAMWTSTIRDISGQEATPINGRSIGEIAVRRDTVHRITDPEERKRRTEENAKLEAGDPKLIWMFGFWLDPAYHRRGIMAAALQTLMDEILIPYMNIHTITGGYLEHNAASRKVFEKCGFSFVALLPNYMTINPLKINGVEGQKSGLGIMEWKRPAST